MSPPAAAIVELGQQARGHVGSRFSRLRVSGASLPRRNRNTSKIINIPNLLWILMDQMDVFADVLADVFADVLADVLANL